MMEFHNSNSMWFIELNKWLWISNSPYLELWSSLSELWGSIIELWSSIITVFCPGFCPLWHCVYLCSYTGGQVNTMFLHGFEKHSLSYRTSIKKEGSELMVRRLLCVVWYHKRASDGANRHPRPDIVYEIILWVESKIAVPSMIMSSADCVKVKLH